MYDLATFQHLLEYNDWANGQIFEASLPLGDNALDLSIEMGRGSLRKTLIHIYAGEFVWLRRWKGEADTQWLDESRRDRVDAIASALRANAEERKAFLNGLSTDDLVRRQRYRDSKGGYYIATLGDMIVQGFIHSTHHRAQAVNMLRNVGATTPELDYMYHVRKPA